MKWISVEERLPERGDHCLFCIPTSINFVVAGFVEDSEYRFIDANILDQYGDPVGYSAKAISHWMPLPEPPNKKFEPVATSFEEAQEHAFHANEI